MRPSRHSGRLESPVDGRRSGRSGSGAGGSSKASTPSGTARPSAAAATPPAEPPVVAPCGLELPARLVWARWQPGGEYAKAIVVKNVCGRVLTVSHVSAGSGGGGGASSGAFCLDFPRPARLSPGMSVALRVVFRPPARRAYADAVTVTCDGAPAAAVRLEAPLAAPALAAPAALDFGVAPVRERVARPLPIANTGAAPLAFAWRVAPPFSISPAVGALAPGESLVCEAAFEPPEAAAFEGAAACEIDGGDGSGGSGSGNAVSGGSGAVVRLTGAAKFPYLALEAPALDFGRVPVGRAATLQLRLGNLSPVEARFAVAAEDAATAAGLPAAVLGGGGGSSSGGGGGDEDGADGEPPVFRVTPAEGTLGPGEYGLLTVTFTPRTAGAAAFQRFVAATPGGNRAALAVSGAGEGPRVVLSARVVDFGDVPVAAPPPPSRSPQRDAGGQHHQQQQGAAAPAPAPPFRVVYLENASDVPARFEFVDDGGGVFLLSPARGSVAPRSVAPVRVAFAPAAPANYWRRLVCVVQDAPAPLSLDVLGTAFDARAAGGGGGGGGGGARPPPLEYAHVRTYLARAAAGGPLVPPADGEADAAGAALQPLSQRQAEDPSAGGEPVGPDGWELLFSGQDPAGALEVSDASLDFGGAPRLSAAEPRALAVTNLTGAKVAVLACVPAWHDPADAPAGGGSGGSSNSGGGGRPAFEVFPESLDLRPGQTATLRVAFRPPRDGRHYAARLLVVAGVKAQRNFRLVAPRRVVPPWSRAVLLTGHTFGGGRVPELSPKVELSPWRVAFPPLRAGSAAHAVVAVVNRGDTPVAFALAPAGRGLPAGLAVTPPRGVVAPRSHALITLRYAPACDAGGAANTLPRLAATLAVVFNDSAADAGRLVVTGGVHEPVVTTSLAPGNRLCLRPTCVGSVSTRTVQVVNAGRVAAAWRWTLSRRLAGAVAVAPAAGALEAGAACDVTFSFAPGEARAYEARAALTVLPAGVGVGDADAEARCPSPGVGDGEEEAVGSGGCKVVVSIAGEGTPGALSIEPAGGARFGAVRVGYCERRTLALVNESEGLLRYRVVVLAEPADGEEQEEEEEEGDDSAKAEEGPGKEGEQQRQRQRHQPQEGDGGGDDGSSGVSPLSAAQARQLAAAMAEASGAADAEAVPVVFEGPSDGGSGGIASGGSGRGAATALLPPADCASECWAEPAEGIIGGRSRALVTVALLPRRRRRCRYRLLVVDAAAPLPPGAVGDAEGGADAAGSSAFAVAAAATTTAAVAVLPLAVARVTADAAFPCVLVTDAACDGAAKPALWRQLGLPALNAALAAPVSAAELRAAALAAAGALTTDGAAALLPPVAIDLGALPLGGAPREVALRLSNPGALEAAWELHSYDDPELRPESWVEPTTPLTPAEAHRAEAVRLGILAAHPRSGRLAARGGSVAVVLRAAPAAEGEWRLPLFLRVRDGRQLHVVLRVRARHAVGPREDGKVSGWTACVQVSCEMTLLSSPSSPPPQNRSSSCRRPRSCRSCRRPPPRCCPRRSATVTRRCRPSRCATAGRRRCGTTSTRRRRCGASPRRATALTCSRMPAARRCAVSLCLLPPPLNPFPDWPGLRRQKKEGLADPQATPQPLPILHNSCRPDPARRRRALPVPLPAARGADLRCRAAAAPRRRRRRRRQQPRTRHRGEGLPPARRGGARGARDG